MTPPTPSRDTALARVWSFLCAPRGWLALLLLFHLCANIWWLWADNHAIRTDEETHMIMAREYYNALFPRYGERGPGARLDALLRIKTEVGNPVHPPLLHLAGALLVRAVGYSVDRLAFVNTLAFLAALVGVYLFAGRFIGEADAFFATLVFSFTPMVYVSSRYFMTDFLSMALVVWVMYALVRTGGFSRTGWSAVYGLLNGLALLARTTVVLYYFLPSLAVFIAGAATLTVLRGDAPFNRRAAIRLAANALLVLVITVAVAGPWYAAHGGAFYQYWMKPDQGGAGAPIALVRETPPSVPAEADTAASATEPRPAAPAAEPSPAAPAAAEPAPDTAPRETSGSGRWVPVRRVPWVRYPVFVINNAVFLPMFVLFLLGMAVCVACKRFRKSPVAWLLLLWVLGAYAMLTLALSFGTPRYALQALPALAILSALPVLALPRSGVRLAARVLYCGLLLFQFGNLSVRAYGPLAGVKLPVYVDREFQEVYDDHGLYFWKSMLHGSFSYGRMQAPMNDNYKDRLFFAMLEEEQKRPFHGIAANYARLNIRGMMLEEQHFWLDGSHINPFRRKDIPPSLTPWRNFRQYGWGRTLDEILPALGLVDYVAYTTEQVAPEQEQEWLRVLEDNGFELVLRFHEERFGRVPARYFGLLARRPEEALPEPASPEAVRELDIDDLYKVRHSAVYRRLAPELRDLVAARIKEMAEERRPGLPLNDHAEYLLARVAHDRDDIYIFRIYLFSRSPRLAEYRALLQGRVAPEVMAAYLNDHSGQWQEFQLLSEPTPSPPLWPEDDLVLLRFPVSMMPMPCQMRFALYVPDVGIQGNIINLGEVDFSRIRRVEE